MTVDDAPETATTFHGLSWVFARLTYAIPALVGFPLAVLACWSAGGVGFTLAPIVGAAGLAVFLLPTRIHIGPEGIALRWLWVSRLLAYEDLGDVSVYDERSWGRWREIGLRIERGSGVIHLPMRYHDRLSLLTRDPTRPAEAAVASIQFHRDHALSPAPP